LIAIEIMTHLSFGVLGVASINCFAWPDSFPAFL